MCAASPATKTLLLTVTYYNHVNRKKTGGQQRKRQMTEHMWRQVQRGCWTEKGRPWQADLCYLTTEKYRTTSNTISTNLKLIQDFSAGALKSGRSFVPIPSTPCKGCRTKTSNISKDCSISWTWSKWIKRRQCVDSLLQLWRTNPLLILPQRQLTPDKLTLSTNCRVQAELQLAKNQNIAHSSVFSSSSYQWSSNNQAEK